MNLQEIINRPNGSEFSQRELEFVVEQYILEQKGVQVNVNASADIPHPTVAMVVLPNQIQKLNMAFNVAQQYFLNKGD